MIEKNYYKLIPLPLYPGFINRGFINNGVGLFKP